MKKDGTARAYQSTLNSLERFFAGKSFKIAEINSLLVGKYECYLITNGITPNSISFYMRNFRAVYNRMKRERGESIAENPFEDIHTSIAKTNKRALKKRISLKYPIWTYTLIRAVSVLQIYLCSAFIRWEWHSLM